MEMVRTANDKVIAQTQDSVVVPIVKRELVVSPRGGAVISSIILSTETEKPVDQFSDEFWREFRAQALQELENVYGEHLPTLFLQSSLFLLTMFFTLGLATEPSLSSATATVSITVSWVIHGKVYLMWCTRVRHHVDLCLPYILMVCFCGIESLVSGIFAQGVLLFILGATNCRYLILLWEKSSVEAFLRAVNAYCQQNLMGYRVEQSSLLSTETTYFVFQRREAVPPLLDRGLDSSTNHDESEAVLVESELRIRLSNVAPCSLGRSPSLISGDTDSFSVSCTQKRPTGIAPDAWKFLLQDICTDIENHEKTKDMLRNVMIIHILVSLGFYFVEHQAINYLLPLHLTSGIIANMDFKKSMKTKFEMIERLGCSTLGSKCHVSYHSVRWYSCREDYILFKRFEDIEKGS